MRDHIERDLSVFLLAGPPDVGVAQLRFRDYLITGEPMVYLEELYVVPDRRGEGHGRALMETAFARARERGATTMELGTALDDTAARGLYESLGFTNFEKAGTRGPDALLRARALIVDDLRLDDRDGSCELSARVSQSKLAPPQESGSGTAFRPPCVPVSSMPLRFWRACCWRACRSTSR